MIQKNEISLKAYLKAHTTSKNNLFVLLLKATNQCHEKLYLSCYTSLRSTSILLSSFVIVFNTRYISIQLRGQFRKIHRNSIPPKRQFYNILDKDGITDKQYLHAQSVFNQFNCGNLDDYHDLYLASDVLLLTDILRYFETHVSRIIIQTLLIFIQVLVQYGKLL